MSIMKRLGIGAGVTTLLAGAIVGYGHITPSKNLSQHVIGGNRRPGNHELAFRDDYSFLAQQDDAIEHAISMAPDVVPLELVLATIISENETRPRLEDWKDTVSVVWNNAIAFPLYRNTQLDLYHSPSLGPGQVRIVTAQSLAQLYLGEEIGREDMQDRLAYPAVNFQYVVLALHDRLYISGRVKPGTPAKDILSDHELIGRVAVEYVMGPVDKVEGEGAQALADFTIKTIAYLPTSLTIEFFEDTYTQGSYKAALRAHLDPDSAVSTTALTHVTND